jgi:hypothetical protein
MRALPSLQIAGINGDRVSVIAVQRLGHASIAHALAHFAGSNRSAITVLYATAIDRSPDAEAVFAGDCLAFLGLAVFRRSAVTLGKVGIANASVGSLGNCADIDQAIQFVEAVVVRVAAAGDILTVALATLAGVQGARFFVVAAPASPVAAIIPAFLSLAERLAKADSVDAGILCTGALPTLSAATVVAAFLSLAERLAKADSSFADLLRAQAEALADAATAVVIATHGLGAVRGTDVDDLHFDDLNAVVSVVYINRRDGVGIGHLGGIGVRQPGSVRISGRTDVRIHQSSGVGIDIMSVHHVLQLPDVVPARI